MPSIRERTPMNCSTPREFIRRVVLEGFFGSVDGADIQEWAEQAGILKLTDVHEPCDPERCICAESGDPPYYCYRFTEEYREET
jgi:hypothetical protein